MEGGSSGSDFEEGEGSGVQEVTQTAYKVYAAVLAERLREEVR